MTDTIKNSGNWYFADLLERSEDVGRNKLNSNRRCLTMINTIIFKAKSFSEAYDKAKRIGKKSYTQRYKACLGNTVQCKFIGIVNLIQIIDDIKDGAEIGWRDLGYISVKRSDNMVISKRMYLNNNIQH